MHVSGAGIILRVHHDIVLFVRGRESNKLSFAKGASRHGESLQQTAMREFYEETGIRVHLGREDRPFVFHKRICKRCYFMCDANHVDTDSMPYLNMLRPYDSDEISEICWVHRSQWKHLTRDMVNLDIWHWLHPTRHLELTDSLSQLSFVPTPNVVPKWQTPWSRSHPEPPTFVLETQEAGTDQRLTEPYGTDRLVAHGRPVASDQVCDTESPSAARVYSETPGRAALPSS